MRNAATRSRGGAWAVVAVAAVAVVLALAGCGRTPPPPPAPAPAPTESAGVTVVPPDERVPAPPLAGESLAGGTVAVSDFAGRPVLVNAWASWCAPCREETPLLVAAARRDPDLAVVGLNVQDRPDAARAFAAEQDIPYPSIVDPSGELLATVPGVPPRALPSTIAIDRQGRLAARAIGPLDRATLREMLTVAGADGKG